MQCLEGMGRGGTLRNAENDGKRSERVPGGQVSVGDAMKGEEDVGGIYMYIPPSGEECLLFLAAPRFAGFLKVQALETISSAFDITDTMVWFI